MATARRHSKQRDTILSELKKVSCHPTADTVYGFVKEIIPNISLGTVYRNLKNLAEDGVILSFTLDGKERFDGNVNPHIHLCCDECGGISDFSLDTQKLKSSVLENNEFSIQNIVINGVCKDCLNK